MTKSVVSMVMSGLSTAISSPKLVALASIVFILNIASQASSELGAETSVEVGAALGVLALGISALVFVANLSISIAIITKQYNSRSSNSRGLIGQIKARFLPMIAVQIVSFFVIIVGFMLFIIPGIYFAYKLYLAPVVCVVERESVIDSLKLSWSYTSQHTFQVLGLLFIVALLQLGVFGLVIVGSFAGVLAPALLVGLVFVVPVAALVNLTVQAATADMVIEYSGATSNTDTNMGSSNRSKMPQEDPSQYTEL